MNKIYVNKTATLISALLLSACANNTEQSGRGKTDGVEYSSFSGMMLTSTSPDQKHQIADGIQLLREKRYEEASSLFNAILNDDPTNSALHTLNGMAYQLKAMDGDFAAYDLAEAGYMQARKFNPSNTYAALLLGRVKREKQDYIGAQEQFAEVLLYDQDNEDALYELALTSYMIGDIKPARASIDQLLKHKPQDANYLRAASMIYAVQGDKEKSHFYLDQLKNRPSNKKEINYLSKRMGDWENLHESGGIQLAQSIGADSTPQAVFIDRSVPRQNVLGGKFSLESSAPQTDEQETGDNSLPQFDDPQGGVVVIDAVILRVIEEGQTKRGHNILENFTLTLSPFNGYFANHAGTAIENASIFTTNNSSTGTGDVGNPVNSIPGSVSSVFNETKDRISFITSGISFGSINYSLNIANATTRHIEVIGRPTLTSHVGRVAQFFNGQQLNISQSGNFGGGVLNQIPTGSTLRVTPTGLKDDYVSIDVEVIDSFLTQNEDKISSNLRANTPLVIGVNSSDVKTTVKLRMGETVMLGGTAERHDITVDSGVPILKEIPFVQLLFSKKERLSSRASVLYLLTPRTVTDYKGKMAAHYEKLKTDRLRPNMKELERRHRTWFDPDTNIVPILRTFGGMHQDFRMDDIVKKNWTEPPFFDETLYNILDFFGVDIDIT